ncbi:MAG: DUF6734 family protein [Bacteroidales bacterium]
MIQKAVFSYFNADESFGNRCGFLQYSDFLFTTALAITCAARHFKEVQVISSSWGVDIFKEIGVPAQFYSNKLDEIKTISPYFWAYGKLLAYCEQKKPFVHIDNDVFLWNPLPDYILNARLCFQSHEPFDVEGYQFYKMLMDCWKAAPYRPDAIVKHPVKDYAYNCGICGGNDLSIYKEWKQCSRDYIFAEENQSLFFDNYPELLIHQNLFHEQYFLACLVKKHNMRRNVKVLNNNALMINNGYPMKKPRYTHLWGTTKQDDYTMFKVRNSLRTFNPKLYLNIITFCKKNKLKYSRDNLSLQKQMVQATIE